MALTPASWDGPLCVAERRADLVSEAELSLIWQGKRFPPGALCSADGSRVEVLYPGRRGSGRGPDYRDAVVVLAGERRLGDIELHLRASDFRQHGHHLDPAYNRLVLHVVYIDDLGVETRLESGARVPVAAFAPWVERRSAYIAGWLGRPALWQDPCATAVARLGEAVVRGRLLAAGERRLRARAAALAAMASEVGMEEALWRALLEAMGYGGDRLGFRALAERLPLAGLRREVAEGGDALLALLAAASALPVAAGGVRPANRPERRLAGVAALLGRCHSDLLAYARHTVATAAGARELIAAWSVQAADKGPALIGADRAVEVLVNAVLPCLVLEEGLVGRVHALVAALPPLPPYGKTRFLEANLKLDGRRFVQRTLEQQGLLAYQGEWCARGGCGRCPLS